MSRDAYGNPIYPGGSVGGDLVADSLHTKSLDVGISPNEYSFPESITSASVGDAMLVATTAPWSLASGKYNHNNLTNKGTYQHSVIDAFIDAHGGPGGDDAKFGTVDVSSRLRVGSGVQIDLVEAKFTIPTVVDEAFYAANAVLAGPSEARSGMTLGGTTTIATSGVGGTALYDLPTSAPTFNAVPKVMITNSTARGMGWQDLQVNQPLLTTTTPTFGGLHVGSLYDLPSTGPTFDAVPKVMITNSTSPGMAWQSLQVNQALLTTSSPTFATIHTTSGPTAGTTVAAETVTAKNQTWKNQDGTNGEFQSKSLVDGAKQTLETWDSAGDQVGMVLSKADTLTEIAMKAKQVGMAVDVLKLGYYGLSTAKVGMQIAKLAHDKGATITFLSEDNKDESWEFGSFPDTGSQPFSFVYNRPAGPFTAFRLVGVSDDPEFEYSLSSNMPNNYFSGNVKVYGKLCDAGANGEMLVGDGGTMYPLYPGNDEQVLTMQAGYPNWVYPPIQWTLFFGGDYGLATSGLGWLTTASHAELMEPKESPSPNFTGYSHYLTSACKLVSISYFTTTGDNTTKMNLAWETPSSGSGDEDHTLPASGYGSIAVGRSFVTGTRLQLGYWGDGNFPGQIVCTLYMLKQ